MKIKDGFILRKIGCDSIVVPVGAASADFHGMIKLNDTAADIWQALSLGDDEAQIVAKLTEKYEVDADTAASAVKATIDKLIAAGILI